MATQGRRENPSSPKGKKKERRGERKPLLYFEVTKRLQGDLPQKEKKKKHSSAGKRGNVAEGEGKIHLGKAPFEAPKV